MVAEADKASELKDVFQVQSIPDTRYFKSVQGRKPNPVAQVAGAGVPGIEAKIAEFAQSGLSRQ
jgi:hypothetical protein